MATYKEIQDFVKRQYGFIPKSCWIAHVKEINKLNPRKAHNRIEENKRTNPCPSNKVENIEQALKHFGMI